MLVVTVVIFLETAFLPASFLPGDSLLFITGLTVATAASPVPTGAAFVLIGAAAVLGAQVSYEAGRAAGPTIMRRPRRWPFTDEVYDRTVALFERLGVRAVIVARFVPIVRALVPLIAGFTRMPRRRYLLVNAVGAVAWVVLFMGAGFFLGGLTAVQQNLELAILIAIVASSLPFPIELAREWWMRRRARRAAEAALPVPAPSPASVGQSGDGVSGE